MQLSQLTPSEKCLGDDQPGWIDLPDSQEKTLPAPAVGMCQIGWSGSIPGIPFTWFLIREKLLLYLPTQYPKLHRPSQGTPFFQA